MVHFRCKCGIGGVLLTVAAALAAYCDEEAPPPAVPAELQQRIDALIAGLGSDRFAEREAASGELLEIGTPAIASLQQALQADDVEVRVRAQKLLHALLPESIPRESVVIEGLNADDGVLLLQGPYDKIAIHSVNGEAAIESEDIDAEELSLGSINGEPKVVLQGKVKRLRIGDINGEPVIDAGKLEAGEIEVGTINGSPTLRLSSGGDVTFTGSVLGGSRVTVSAKGDVTVKDSVHGGVHLVVLASKDFAVKGSVGGGVTIVAAYTGRATCDAPPGANIQLNKTDPPE